MRIDKFSPSGLLVVVAVVLGVGLAFLYVGGRLSPHRLTQARFVDTFEHLNGVSPGFRRNHAKGVGVSGYFESNGEGERLSKASVFRPGRYDVIGRFALSGGMPRAPDSLQTVRSMALRFALPAGEEWRTGMIDIPVFTARTPESFRDQLIATAPDPKSGEPDPGRVRAYLAKYPESARAIEQVKARAPTAGFDDSTYDSLNAFILVDAAGRATPVRWAMVPAEPLGREPPAPESDPNFLFDRLIERLHGQPLRWHLVLTLGQPGRFDGRLDRRLAGRPGEGRRRDPHDRTHRERGHEPGARHQVRSPMLPSGIVGSEDPILSARAATYSVSYRRRVSEPATPSPVTPAEVGE